MRTIMVSGASGVVGYGCLKSLKQQKKYRLVGTSIYDSDVVRYFSDIFVIAPHTDNEMYLEWLKNTVQEYHIEILIPGIEIDMYKWNANRKVIESWGVKLLLNTKELIDLCYDKWKFYEKLKQIDNSLCIPTYINKEYEEIRKIVGDRILIKPRNGYASKGIKKVTSKKEYLFYTEGNAEHLMVQKEIQGEEYTVGAFYDNKSNLCNYISMERKLGTGGFTEYAEVKEVPQLKDILIKLGKAFRAVGPTNFQFINDGGVLKLLEINPRISSTTHIRTLFGYNECSMGVEFIADSIIPESISLRKGRATRYIEEMVEYDRDYI